MPHDKEGNFYYSWYPEKYQSATQVLNLAEDGAYHRLIDHYMQTREPLLDDDRALCRIVGVTIEEWQSVKEKVRNKFVPTNNPVGYLSHKFCDKMINKENLSREKAKNNGKKGGRPNRFEKSEKTPYEQPTGNPPVTHREPTGLLPIYIEPAGARSSNNLLTKEDSKEESKKERKADSDEKSSGDLESPPVDFKRVIFNEGLKMVGGEKSRTLVAKWVKDHGAAAVCAAMLEAQKQSAIEPKTYIMKILNSKGTPGERYTGQNRNPG